jgi:hypothetical protein
VTSPTEGGVRGGIPPGIHSTTGTSKSPSEAVFILLEVTPKARQPLFFWRLLLKPGSPYCRVRLSPPQRLQVELTVEHAA